MPIASHCHLIAVTGGKGGVGKSVLAANLALALQGDTKAPVLVIDADSRSCGDLNVVFGVKPQKILSEFVQFQGVMTPQNLNQIVTQHPTGIHFLGAVRGPDEILNVNSSIFIKSLELISRHYKTIVIDVGCDLKDLQLSILKEATATLVVTSPEILVVNQTKRLCNELLAATLPKESLFLIVNKMTSQGLQPQTISQALMIPIMTVVPADEATAVNSVTRGQPFFAFAKQSPMVASLQEISRKLLGGTLQKLKQIARPNSQNLNPSQLAAGGSSDFADTDVRNDFKKKVHQTLIVEMDLKKGITETNNDPAKESKLRQDTLQKISGIVDSQSPGLARDERSRIIQEVLDEALGLGPLESLLADPAITEIMVNGHKKIFVEKAGRAGLHPVTFTSNLHLRNVIERIVTPLGRRIDEKTPYVDGRLKDGSRVNAVIEPLAIDGPALTIRKFKKGGISPEQYLGYGTLTANMVEFLRLCVENGINIVISGGTGSGKTSLLNMLSAFIPTHERVITIEDAAELQLRQEHVVRLEARPATMEGSGSVTIRDLVRNALRMRPDRIIVGECRDGAALDMLSAMNTGHDGSMTTTHANTPKECISRLENLCLMAGMDLPQRAIREQIASAIQIIVQVQRLSDGSRKVTHITEVQSMKGDDIVPLGDVFLFKETGYTPDGKIIGEFKSPGFMPSFMEKIKKKGVKIPENLFSNEVHGSSSPQNVTPLPKVGLKETSPAATSTPLKKTQNGGHR